MTSLRSSEIEQIEIEFTDVQNRVQKVRDELRSREVYSKFVEQLNKEQSVLLDKEQHSFSMQSDSKVIEQGEITESNL